MEAAIPTPFPTGVFFSFAAEEMILIFLQNTAPSSIADPPPSTAHHHAAFSIDAELAAAIQALQSADPATVLPCDLLTEAVRTGSAHLLSYAAFHAAPLGEGVMACVRECAMPTSFADPAQTELETWEYINFGTQWTMPPNFAEADSRWEFTTQPPPSRTLALSRQLVEKSTTWQTLAGHHYMNIPPDSPSHAMFQILSLQPFPNSQRWELTAQSQR